MYILIKERCLPPEEKKYQECLLLFKIFNIITLRHLLLKKILHIIQMRNSRPIYIERMQDKKNKTECDVCY